VQEVRRALVEGLEPDWVFSASDYLKDPKEIDRMLERDLTDEPVFGRMNGIIIGDFFDETELGKLKVEIAAFTQGLILVIGTGAALLAPEPDLLIYADMARWEIQRRQRCGEAGNLGAKNETESPSLKYKRSYFVDWRAADRLKKELLPKIDFLLDTNDRFLPKLVTRENLFRGLKLTVERPLRVVPLFDP
jgi:hypothetical protein